MYNPIAFVFPGQGSQYPGMGKEMAERFPCANHIYKTADQVLGFPLSTICFEGTKEKLNKTEITQAAVLTTSIATFMVLKEEGLLPFMAAGLSLGEYSALVASGALQFEDALRLVVKRGQIMQQAVPAGQGIMAAVLGVKEDTVKQACTEASSSGIVEIANYNCPGQIVISGERQGVLKAGDLLQETGARVVPLAVSVPSHCRLMKNAAIALQTELEMINWSEPEFPVVSNVKAREIHRSDLPGVLVEQLYRSVKWEQSTAHMSERVDYFIEVGPGKVLSGLIKKTAKNKALGSVQDSASLDRILKKLKQVFS
ncbi:MAG: ACP S-malonyltransferase [Syntrophaceticus sp.]|jgi:[acyl-carrier-protein] S-malonyltransferase|nr:ACP S-malonyltransferase [Syntrophaceticus sp.]MDD3313973.1 ACP S-malonyltransferase [Syntrophaceticus sp.]MDD4359050.1 ACP S-malonyltransferase [Syntrophaceticus sp.]MDD4783125.1 ACP S-malonyltransferase [Syntrophaceticus sp.]HBI26504.1 [acyl-carrier-protein] S-malonyltransferase [Peptococcaceae bacterium]